MAGGAATHNPATIARRSGALHGLADWSHASAPLALLALLSAILFCPPSALAQDAATLHAQVLELLGRGDVEQAAHKAEVLRERVTRESGENSLPFAEALQAYGMIHMLRGELGEAENAVKRAMELVEGLAPDDEVRRGASITMLATIYAMQGRAEDARKLQSRGGALMQLSMPEGVDIRRFNELDSANPAHFDELEKLHSAMIAHFEKELPQNDATLVRLLIPLAHLYIQHDKCAEAEPLLARMGKVASETALGMMEVGMLKHYTADCLVKRGAYPEAEQLYLEELSEYRAKVGDSIAFSAGVLQSLVTLNLARHRPDEALRYARQHARGQRLRIRAGAGSTGTLSRGPASRATSYAFDYLVASAWRLAEADTAARPRLLHEAFEAAQWSARNRAGEAVGQLGVRLAAGTGELATAVRRTQELREQWAERDRTLVQLVAAGAQAEKLAGARREIDGIERDLAESERALAINFPTFQALAGLETLELPFAQRLLSRREALVQIVVADQESFVFVITDREARWFRVDMGERALGAHVAALRCGLDDAAWNDAGGYDRCTKAVKAPRVDQTVGGQVVSVLPFDLERAYALYRTLFGQAEDMIRGKHLLIVPSGPLTSLPFHVLVTRPPSAAIPSKPAGARDASWLGPYRKTAWLGARQPITVLPSVFSLKALREQAKDSRASRPYIGVGNPLLTGYPGSRDDDAAQAEIAKDHARWAQEARANQSCRLPRPRRIGAPAGARGSVRRIETQGGLANLAHLKTQVPLPETADELCAVARAVKADPRQIRLGAQASEREMKRLSASGELARFRVLHFATHGAVAGEIAGTHEPGLILTPPETASEEDDGYLSAPEIAELKLDADWVVLSACNTAAGGATSAEALSGLARAFIYAGARALLVSHWAVDSDTAVALVKTAVGEIARNPTVGRAEALRRAMRAVIHEGDPEWAHPAYWAPFVVVGEGAAGRR